MIINGYELRLTCSACPEQYDVFKDDTPVGYLRLRHGQFTAQVPGPGGEVIYSACPNGDGIFDDSEREKYLKAAITEIDKFLNKPLQDLVPGDPTNPQQFVLPCPDCYAELTIEVFNNIPKIISSKHRS